MEVTGRKIFLNGKTVGIVRRDEESYDILPNDIIEKLPGANAAFCSMFTTDEKKDTFVNDYSYTVSIQRTSRAL